MSGESKEGLAASFGLVFHPPEGQCNNRNTKQVRVSFRKLASGAFAFELEPDSLLSELTPQATEFPVLVIEPQ